MQKQKKNSHTKKFKDNFKYLSKPLFKRVKVLKRCLRISRYSQNITKSLNFDDLNLTNSIYIRLTANNVFCSCKTLNKTILVGSAGIYKVKTSIKKLRFSSKIILEMFLKRLQKYINSNPISIKIIGPIKIKKNLIKLFSKLKHSFLKKNVKYFVINSKSKKCFNGCRPKKKIRKKRRYKRFIK